MHNSTPIVGSIEAGGTKFVCSIGSGPGAILARERFPTDQDGHPERTIAVCAEWFRVTQVRLGVSIGRCGVGSFGPVDLVSGRIGPTPKPGWRDFPIREALAQALASSGAVAVRLEFPWQRAWFVPEIGECNTRQSCFRPERWGGIDLLERD